MRFVFKENYGVGDLLEIMSILRSPDGCPWDKEQTHRSIRRNFIEEVFEAAEAIDDNNAELLKEELGDVLLQIVFHSQMAKESGNFDFDDVCDEICKKLIVRHPHVFSDASADTSEKVLNNWDEIKKKTKGYSSQSEAMQAVSKALPALIRSEKIQAKAAKVGFDWDNVEGAFNKVVEETTELLEAIKSGDILKQSEELGDLLFAVVNVSRFLKIDAEESLNLANIKFVERFKTVEELAEASGIEMKSTSIEVLDKLWELAKIKVAGAETT